MYADAFSAVTLTAVLAFCHGTSTLTSTSSSIVDDEIAQFLKINKNNIIVYDNYYYTTSAAIVKWLK